MEDLKAEQEEMNQWDKKAEKGLDDYFAFEEERNKLDEEFLAKIKTQVTPEFFEIIEEEIEESEYAFNFRIEDEPSGSLQDTIDGVEIYISQHSRGDSGDSWEGEVNIKLPNGKYLVFDFEM